MLDKVLVAIGAVFGVCVLLFVAVLVNTVLGGIIGWVVGMVFPFVITSLNNIAGLTLTGFQVGAVLGFVSGFFRSNISTKS